MKVHQGMRLSAYLHNLRLQKVQTIGDAAEKMGIRQESLSALFRKEELSAEMREAAIKAFSLPATFFEPTDEMPGAPPPTTRQDDLAALRAEVALQIKEVEKWKEKYIVLLEQMLKKNIPQNDKLE